MCFKLFFFIFVCFVVVFLLFCNDDICLVSGVVNIFKGLNFFFKLIIIIVLFYGFVMSVVISM